LSGKDEIESKKLTKTLPSWPPFFFIVDIPSKHTQTWSFKKRSLVGTKPYNVESNGSSSRSGQPWYHF